MTRLERATSSKTLTSLLQALEGERTVVELRDEAVVVGVINNVDSNMNIEMVDVSFSRTRHGVEKSYEKFFVAAKHLRYVHIPDHINVAVALEKRLDILTRRPKTKFDQRQTKKDKMQNAFDRQISRMSTASTSTSN